MHFLSSCLSKVLRNPQNLGLSCDLEGHSEHARGGTIPVTRVLLSFILALTVLPAPSGASSGPTASGRGSPDPTDCGPGVWAQGKSPRASRGRAICHLQRRLKEVPRGLWQPRLPTLVSGCALWADRAAFPPKPCQPLSILAPQTQETRIRILTSSLGDSNTRSSLSATVRAGLQQEGADPKLG